MIRCSGDQHTNQENGNLSSHTLVCVCVTERGAVMKREVKRQGVCVCVTERGAVMSGEVKRQGETEPLGQEKTTWREKRK